MPSRCRFVSPAVCGAKLIENTSTILVLDQPLACQLRVRGSAPITPLPACNWPAGWRVAVVFFRFFNYPPVLFIHPVDKVDKFDGCIVVCGSICRIRVRR